MAHCHLEKPSENSQPLSGQALESGSLGLDLGYSSYVLLLKGQLSMPISLGSNSCGFSKPTWQVSLSPAHRAMAEISREVLEGANAKIETFRVRRQSLKDGMIGCVSFYGVKKFNFV